jgi:hypothetical protein
MTRAAFALPLTVAIFALASSWADVEVGGVLYDHVDAGEPFTATAQPADDWAVPPSTAAEAAAGMIAYWRPAPEELLPSSRPRPNELIRRPLRVFAARGETEPLWIAVYARDDLARITARLENLIPAVSAELFVVHFWPQRTSWRTREYYITPELLLPYEASEGYAWFPARHILERRPYDLKANTTGAIWLRLDVSRSAPPGIHRFTLALKAENRKPLAVPIELEILPFELIKPADKSWLIYGDMGRWRHMTDAQRWLDAKDYATHGMDGIVEMPLGSADFTELAQGRVKWDISETRRYLELLKQAGMKGPWVVVGGVAWQVRQALGSSADLNQPWPDQIRQGVQAAARAAAEAFATLGIEWFFYGVDEPSADNVYAVEDYRNWKAGGVPVYVTICQPDFWTSMAEYLDAPCFASFMVSNPEACEKTREACERLGKQFWWYGSGSYTGQEGRMFPNRFLAGYLFWKTGARCQVSWTYVRPHEDPFNDFDGEKANSMEPKEQATVYPWLERPGDWSSYRGPIQTIQWEALREGVDDYRYLHTLKELADKAAGAPGIERARAGRKAKRALRDIVEALPWASELPGLGFGNRECQSVRRLVATHIQELQAGTLGTPGSRPAERTIKIHIDMRPASQAPARTLPVVAVPRLATAPTIDGSIDEHVWAQAATVNTFRDTRTAELLEPPTQAWVGCDDTALYIAFRCHEPMMDRIVAQHTGRDANEIWLDDGVEVFVDPSGERTRYAHFIVNAGGAMLDEIREDTSWNSSAKAAVTRQKDHWQAELAIPWADLESAGLKRGPVMALNLCRNRFADPKSRWRHAAWSVTYSWFHVPDRFGIALPEEGDIGLLDLDLPTLFGRQMLRMALINRTDKPELVRVQAVAHYEGQETVLAPEGLLLQMQPKQRVEAQVPIVLAHPGKAHIQIAYGPHEGPVRTADFQVTVPEPATVATRLISIRPETPLQAVVELNVSPSDHESYTASATYLAAERTWWRGSFRCTPGRTATLEGRAQVPTTVGWLELNLRRANQLLWQTRLPVMPEFDALAPGRG